MIAKQSAATSKDPKRIVLSFLHRVRAAAHIFFPRDCRGRAGNCTSSNPAPVAKSPSIARWRRRVPALRAGIDVVPSPRTLVIGPDQSSCDGGPLTSERSPLNSSEGVAATISDAAQQHRKRLSDLVQKSST